MTPTVKERIGRIIKSCQVDFGHHRYGNLKERKIKDCCNVDIENLTAALIEAGVVFRDELSLCGICECKLNHPQPCRCWDDR